MYEWKCMRSFLFLRFLKILYPTTRMTITYTLIEKHWHFLLSIINKSVFRPVEIYNIYEALLFHFKRSLKITKVCRHKSTSIFLNVSFINCKNPYLLSSLSPIYVQITHQIFLVFIFSCIVHMYMQTYKWIWKIHIHRIY